VRDIVSFWSVKYIDGHELRAPTTPTSTFLPGEPRLNALILLVDSDVDTRIILRATFEHRGYEVLEASDGAEGLRLVAERRPDVIVGDFPMDVPGHSPFTAAARSLGRRDAAILAFTSRALHADLKAARAVCDAVVTKPGSPLKLVELVDRLLGEPRRR